VGIDHVDDPIAAYQLAGDAHLFVQHAAVLHLRQLSHHVHATTASSRTASSRWLRARSKASKLRHARAAGSALARRLASRGTRCSEMPPCERNGTSRPDKSCFAALEPSTVSRSETITRSPTRSGGNSKRAQASRRNRTTSTPASA